MLVRLFASSVLAALLSGYVPILAQPASLNAGLVHVSGRLVDSAHRPDSNMVISFRETPESRQKEKLVRTDTHGEFTTDLEPHIPYLVSWHGNENQWAELGVFSFGDATQVELGDVLLRSLAGDRFALRLASPLHVVVSDRNHNTPANPDMRIAAVHVTCPPEEDCRGSRAHIFLTNGQEVVPSLEKDQVGASQPLISPDNRAAGWLVDFNNCCTSYPLSAPLIVYRPGKSLLRVFGDKRAIFDWHFLAEGKQVATCQEFPHGDPVPHYELHDVGSGRLLGSWDVPPTDDEENDQVRKMPAPKPPTWVDSFADNC